MEEDSVPLRFISHSIFIYGIISTGGRISLDGRDEVGTCSDEAKTNLSCRYRLIEGQKKRGRLTSADLKFIYLKTLRAFS